MKNNRIISLQDIIVDIKDDMITGNEIISLAHELLLIVKKIINTKYLWLECEDNSSLIRFYSNYGFNLIKKFSSKNNLKTMILRLDNF